MDDRSVDASALAQMDGLVVLTQTEEDGECWVLVETTSDQPGCPSCGVQATGHGQSIVQVRDLPAGGRPVRLVWRKRRWICLDPDCPAKSFSEETPLVEGSPTRRAATEICGSVGQDGSSVAQVAREFAVSWDTTMDCVRRHGELLAGDEQRLDSVVAMGVDDHKMLTATKDHRSLFVTNIVDLKARGRLLAVLRGRSGDDIAYWLTQMGGPGHERIGSVAIDPHRGYANALLGRVPMSRSALTIATRSSPSMEPSKTRVGASSRRRPGTGGGRPTPSTAPDAS